MLGLAVKLFTLLAIFNVATALRESERDAIEADLRKLFQTFRPPSGFFLPATTLRLAFHDAGTWSNDKGNGGAHGVQFFNCVKGQIVCEQNYPDNTGLAWAIDTLETVYKNHKFQLSRADFWQLAAVVAVEFTGGPALDFVWGRTDLTAEWSQLARLPGANGGVDHLRSFMGSARLGLNDEEITCLLGAHTIGGSHPQYSGHNWNWDQTPTRFDNSYFQSLLINDWHWTSQWGGQWETTRRVNGQNQHFLMLNADMALKRNINNPNQLSPLVGLVQKFANDQKAFFDCFTNAWRKVSTNGGKNLRKVCGDDDADCVWLPPAIPANKPPISPGVRGGQPYYTPKPKYYGPTPVPVARPPPPPPSSFPVPQPVPVPKPVPVPVPQPVFVPQPVPVPEPVEVPAPVPAPHGTSGDNRVTTTGEPTPVPLPNGGTGTTSVPNPAPAPLPNGGTGTTAVPVLAPVPLPEGGTGTTGTTGTPVTVPPPPQTGTTGTPPAGTPPAGTPPPPPTGTPPAGPPPLPTTAVTTPSSFPPPTGTPPPPVTGTTFPVLVTAPVAPEGFLPLPPPSDFLFDDELPPLPNFVGGNRNQREGDSSAGGAGTPSTAWIWGVVAGGVVAIIVVLAFLFILYKRTKANNDVERP